jgi:hypothetical protein
MVVVPVANAMGVAMPCSIGCGGAKQGGGQNDGKKGFYWFSSFARAKPLADAARRRFDL